MPAGVDVPPLDEPRERELDTRAEILGVAQPDLALVVHLGLHVQREEKGRFQSSENCEKKLALAKS